ncbi:hypothetical protein N658DRAFT_45314 [Parathielavia hyrcaniae]|uniref:Uncharacterized protein n=1 Tax=Parathielavia hyrcaniae TaxID=113614 RepID=A0AAN6PSM8_9PEZI|nr:hypothetical protein N658DRAFT_45314 [Parathielavia hyrcaniae]
MLTNGSQNDVEDVMAIISDSDSEDESETFAQDHDFSTPVTGEDDSDQGYDEVGEEGDDNSDDDEADNNIPPSPDIAAPDKKNHENANDPPQSISILATDLARQVKHLRSQVDRAAEDMSRLTEERNRAWDTADKLLQNSTQTNQDFMRALGSRQREADSAKSAWGWTHSELARREQQLRDALAQLDAALRDSDWDRQQLGEMAGDLAAEFEKRAAAERRVAAFEAELRATDKELAAMEKRACEAEDKLTRAEVEFCEKYCLLSGRFEKLQTLHESYLQQLRDATDTVKGAERMAEIMVVVREELSAAVLAAESRQQQMLEQAREVGQRMEGMVNSFGCRIVKASQGYSDGNSRLEANMKAFLAERVTLTMREQFKCLEERILRMQAATGPTSLPLRYTRPHDY